jgi:hypothetical protein
MALKRRNGHPLAFLPAFRAAFRAALDLLHHTLYNVCDGLHTLYNA